MIIRCAAQRLSTPGTSNPTKNYTTLQHTSVSASLVAGVPYLGVLAMWGLIQSVESRFWTTAKYHL